MLALAKKMQVQANTGLPELVAGEYIVEAMMTLGPTRSNGMAEVATDWDIILPFVSATGRLSEAWEIETLADMCRLYAVGKGEGENALSIPPVERGGHAGAPRGSR